MFAEFNDSIVNNIHILLSWWAVLGFFCSGFMPRCNGDKKKALVQTFILGPFFWIGVPVVGLFYLAKNKFNSTE